MADGIAPGVDKVGIPPPAASTRDAQAPTSSGLPGAAPSFKPTSAPTGPSIPGLNSIPPSEPPSSSGAANAGLEKSALPSVEEKKLEHGAGGAGPAPSAPKPVEVMSVPDTPINGSTPAGGTPRPELNIPTEKVEMPTSSAAPTSDAHKAEAPSVTTGVQEPAPTPAVSLPKGESIPEPIKDSPSGPGLNGKPAGEPAVMTGAIQSNDDSAPAQPSSLKRKLEDDKPSAPLNGDATTSQPEPERAEKKTKLNDSGAAASAPSSKPETNSTSTTTENTANKDSGKTNGRAKKGMGKRAKKIAEAVVGKTARKTRSQGAA